MQHPRYMDIGIKHFIKNQPTLESSDGPATHISHVIVLEATK